MFTVLIVEDDFEEIEYCCHLIKQILPESHILKAGSSRKALQLISSHMVDLFLLDVELPDRNGFYLAEMIRRNERHLLTPIVFITSTRVNQLEIHRKYHHYEFIEKPYTSKMFKQLLGPMILHTNKQVSSVEINQTTELDKIIIIEAHDQNAFVKLKDLYCIQSQWRKLIVYTRQGVFRGVNQSLEHFIQYVDEEYFLRCHKSFAINTRNIITIKNEERRIWNAYFEKDEQLECPISLTYYHTIQEMIKQNGQNQKAIT